MITCFLMQNYDIFSNKPSFSRKNNLPLQPLSTHRIGKMKESFKLVALLAISIGTLMAYAFLPEQVAEQLHLKQVGLEALATNSDKQQAMDEEADSLSQEPVDTTAQRILIFGDSMSEYLGLRLADYTNKNGHKLTCVTWVGSGTRNWASTDTLTHYIRKIHPTHVFVCLGSNEFYLTDMKGCERRVRAILAKIGNIPTVWIGPPNWAEDHGYNKMLREVMGSKGYFPSYQLTFERQEDGRHPTMKSSAIWMDKIIEWMNSGHSVHPFRMEMPDKHNRHYQQITILPPGTKRSAVKEMGVDSLATPNEETEHAAVEATSESKTTVPDSI